MKLHRKIKRNEKCDAHMILVPTPKVRLQSGQRSRSCLNNNSETTEANLRKLHRKIEHNEKVCCTQKLGSYAQGKGHNYVRGQTD